MKRNTKIVTVIGLLISLSNICLAEDKTDDPNVIAEKALKNKESIQRIHMAFSTACFNKCWKFIEKKDRTPEDVEDMILLANASLWHWKQRADCKPLNLSIAYWQLGRVNTLAGNLPLAKQYGQKCLKISKENKCGPFATGYAYEVLARAYAMGKESEKANEYLELAKKELKEVKDKFNNKLLKDDLQTIEKLLDK